MPGNSKVFCRTQVPKYYSPCQGGMRLCIPDPRYFSSLLLAAAFLVPAVTMGCGGRTYHDSYYNDIIAGTTVRGFTTINGSSRPIVTTATSAISTGTSKSNIGSGVTTITRKSTNPPTDHAGTAALGRPVGRSIDSRVARAPSPAAFDFNFRVRSSMPGNTRMNLNHPQTKRSKPI